MKKEDKNPIPFGKPVRFWNYKLWRSMYKMTISPTDEERAQTRERSKGRMRAVSRTVDIEQINVSTLDGTFQVKIPQTTEMFGMISASYGELDNESREVSERNERYLRTVLSNIMYVSSICNGHFHQGINMVTTAYAFPDVLREKKKFANFKKDASELIKHFLAWRDDYDKMVKQNEPTEEDMHKDEIADEAMAILSKEN